jgi:hypothetical protein
MNRLHALRMGLAASLAALAPGSEAQTAPRCESCGTVADIRQSTTKSTWTPLGSATPGTSISGDNTPGRVTAAYQIGPEMKNKGMVLLGSAGGGSYAKRPNEVDLMRWELVVRMDSGGPPRIVSMSYDPPFRVGDRVRVFGTQLELVSP